MKDSNKIEKCEDISDHDLNNPIWKGRANAVCRKCGENITLLLLFIEDAKRKNI